MRIISAVSVSAAFSLCLVSLVALAGYPENDAATDTRHESVVPATLDLAQDAAYAYSHKLPMVLVFAAAHCDYCKLLEQEVLDPMYISNDYQDKVVIRRVMIDGLRTLRDFSGVATDADSFAKKYNIQVTPTVVFVDHLGQEIAPRLLGVNTIEMYSAYLDKAIDVSYQVIQTRATRID